MLSSGFRASSSASTVEGVESYLDIPLWYLDVSFLGGGGAGGAVQAH